MYILNTIAVTYLNTNNITKVTSEQCRSISKIKNYTKNVGKKN